MKNIKTIKMLMGTGTPRNAPPSKPTTLKPVSIKPITGDGVEIILSDKVKTVYAGDDHRPRITAAQIATIMEKSRAKAEAGRGKGEGDYTAEKKLRPPLSEEEKRRRVERYKAEAEAAGVFG